MKTYTEWLKSPEWRARRAEIIELANEQCQECGRCKVGCERCDHHDDFVDHFEVHHKFYIRGRKPWEYPDECLQCLCGVCHEERTLLDEAIKATIGLLDKCNQERLLMHAKTLLAKQVSQFGHPIPRKDLPAEVVEAADMSVLYDDITKTAGRNSVDARLAAIEQRLLDIKDHLKISADIDQKRAELIRERKLLARN